MACGAVGALGAAAPLVDLCAALRRAGDLADASAAASSSCTQKHHSTQQAIGVESILS
jgi:hypothetical protein